MSYNLDISILKISDEINTLKKYTKKKKIGEKHENDLNLFRKAQYQSKETFYTCTYST